MSDMQELQTKAAVEVSKRIKSYTKTNRTTMESVARQLGCSKTAFYQKLNGYAPFTMFEGYTLSKMLGCSIVDFFESDYEMAQAS